MGVHACRWIAVSLCLACAAHKPPALPRATVEPMRWGDPERVTKIVAAANELAGPLIRAHVARTSVPGVAVGIVANGKLIWFRGWGVRDVATNAPIDEDTVFRIASMSKSFIAAAVLKLRDEGKLSLEEPVETYLPELKRVIYPTADSPRMTLRHLLSHAAGLPEDDPVADLRMSLSDTESERLLAAGVSFSSVPGTAYEYSNLGFVLAAKVVSRVTGMSYQEYASRHLLAPLGMRGAVWEATQVPEAHRAHGYGRREPPSGPPGDKNAADALYAEPVLADGAWAPPGGLWTSPSEYARWVAFQLAAWPPRDDSEEGPVRRASVREMHHLHRVNAFQATRDDAGVLEVNTGGYGFGWHVRSTCRFTRSTHGGGLPGYGSFVALLPDQDVGIFAMSNVTYGYGAELVLGLANGLYDRGLVPSRPRPLSPALEHASDRVLALLASWEVDRAASLFDVNHSHYEAPEQLRSRLERFQSRHGTCKELLQANPQNALRGRMTIACDRGALEMYLELSSDVPSRIQTLTLESVMEPSAQLRRAALDAATLLRKWDDQTARNMLGPDVSLEPTRKAFARLTMNQGACTLGASSRSDGEAQAAFLMACERGKAELSLTVDRTAGHVKEVSVSTVPGSAPCPM